MSKLGVHVSNGNRRGFGEYLQLAAGAGSPVPVVFTLDQDVWPDVAQFSPETIVIFRHQNSDPSTGGEDGPGDAYVGDPVQSARRWMAANMAVWRQNRAHYCAPLNEQDPGTLAGFEWLNAFTVECLLIADAAVSESTPNGFKLALYAFSAGNPKDLLDPVTGAVVATPEQCWQKLIPSLQYAKAHGHILLLHEYGFDSPAANGGPATSLRASAPDLALRYRRSYRYLHPFNADPPLVVSEASAGVGGFGALGKAAWLADAKWYDGELMRDRVVLGCCLYQVGGAENIKDALPDLAAYSADTPTPEPEGDPVVGIEPVDPPPMGGRGKPRLDFKRLVYVPDGGTAAQRAAVRERLEPDGVGEYSTSMDAAMMGDLSDRTVRVFGPAAARRSEIEQFRDTYYPGVNLIFSDWPGSAPIDPPPTSTGWCPFAVKRPLTNGAYWSGRNGRAVKAVCLHIAEGPLSAVYPWFNRAGSQQSSHFCIGKDGTIEQYVSINDSAWANGKVDHPTWSGLIAGVNPNYYTISIEHEGYYTHVRTAAMDAALVKLLRWLTAQGVVTPWTPHVNLIGHCEIDSVSRANCPGPHCNFERIAAAANNVTPTPIPDVTFVGGVGAGSPQPLTERELEAFRISRVPAFKLLTLADTIDMMGAVSAVRRVRPDAFIMARLFYKPDSDHLHRFDAAEFVATVTPGLSAAYAAGVRYFEIHNEPNVPDEGMGWNWRGGGEFATWLLNVLAILQPIYPDAKWGYPGLSSNPAMNPVNFWVTSQSAALACDWIGVHSYWQTEGDTGWGMTSIDGGWHWTLARAMFPGKPLYLTEFSNNNPAVGYDAKGSQYATYLKLLAQEPAMAGAFAFALSWPGVPDTNREAWVVNNVVTQIPVALGARLALARIRHALENE